MCDRSYASPNRSRDRCCSTLARQESISTLTFDNVSAHQMGNLGVRPVNGIMDLNEMGHHGHSHNHGHHLENPSWGEIVSADQSGGQVNNEQLRFNQQMAMAETTLEDFLVHAGFINYEIRDDRVSYNNDNGDNQLQQQQQQLNPIGVINQDPLVMVSQRPAAADWMQQQLMAMSSRIEVAAEFSGENGGGFEVCFGESQVSSFGVSEAAGISGGSPGDSGVAIEKKRRRSDEVLDKTVERRQKRMIKNRESAARSRARKQAYTNQLECEVARLRKANNWLRRQKEVDLLFKSDSNSKPKYQLRRTSSAQF